MTPINLEDVESYLVKMTKMTECHYTPLELEHWIRMRFAELHAREEAKTHVK